MRYGLCGEAPNILQDIALKLGKSREWIRQIEAAAIKKLRVEAPDLEMFQ